MIRVKGNRKVKTEILKRIAFLMLIISSYSLLAYGSSRMMNDGESNNVKGADSLKREALTVLQNRCNVCHRTENPGKVFTRDNMNKLAPKIYKQVFVKRRMPKKGKLTEEERKALFEWLKAQTSVDD